MNKLGNIASEVSAFSIFQSLTKSSIIELCQSGEVITSKHHEYIFHYGEEAHYFGVVLSGAYKLCRPTSIGEDVIVYFSTPGDVVAAFIMAQPKPVYPVSVVSMGPSRFLKLPAEIYLQYWKKNSELVFRIQNLLSSRMNLLQDEKAMTRAPLSQKIAALLISLVGKQTDKSALILPLPLTRREIADNMGSSVEAVIRIMSDWSKQGIIETNDQQIHILKPEKLIQEFSISK